MQIIQASTDETVLTKAYNLALRSGSKDVGDRVIRHDFNAEWHGRDTEVVARKRRVVVDLMDAQQRLSKPGLGIT